MQQKNCNACPRECGAARSSDQKGFCQVSGEGFLVARAALHMWEEPCISGTMGSGTIFFSGCNLRCIYCQNQKISRGKSGKTISGERLGEIFFELEAKGAANINLVTPSHYVRQLLPVLFQVKKQGLKIPIAFNCGGYEKPEILKELDGLIDIYLTDFKYMEEDLAQRYSAARDYPKWAKAALAEMVQQCPNAVFDANGMMRSGVIVRHLLLPGHVRNGKAVLQYLYETYGNQIYISLMSQYTPTKQVKDIPDLNRTVTRREYDRLVQYMLDLGIKQGFCQDKTAARDCYIPAFENEGV